MSNPDRLRIRCPKCNSTDVRLSHSRSPWDVILDFLFAMDAYRCRACRARFHKLDPGGDGDGVAETDRATTVERRR